MPGIAPCSVELCGASAAAHQFLRESAVEAAIPYEITDERGIRFFDHELTAEEEAIAKHPPGLPRKLLAMPLKELNIAKTAEPEHREQERRRSFRAGALVAFRHRRLNFKRLAASTCR